MVNVDQHDNQQNAQHSKWMKSCLALASANLGQTWPNPTVGAIVVKNGQAVGGGATARGGRPHAETIALNQAGNQAAGATLYVSLEPCAHYGKTPPCVNSIISAKISECIIACIDPNKQVNGGGIKLLEEAGIKVTVGICENEAREINRGFFSVIEKKRPFIAMKIAISKDGKIAAKFGERTNITGEAARLHGQELRAEFDAILTGIGTILADDPLLTVRISGLENRSPLRIILDSKGRIPENSKLLKTKDDSPIWIIDSGQQGIAHIVNEITNRGITRLLIEAGQAVNTSFLNSGLVDRIYCYLSPDEIGEQGLDAVEGGLDFAGWQIVGKELLERDNLIIYEK